MVFLSNLSINVIFTKQKGIGPKNIFFILTIISDLKKEINASIWLSYTPQTV